MTNPVNPQSPSKPTEVRGHNDYLVESQEEIARILLEIMQSGAQFAAYMNAGESFVLCRILGVDVAHDSVFLEFGTDAQMADPFLKAKELCYVGLLEDAKIQFNGTQPHSVDYHGQPAFRIHLPKKLWRMQRRASQRYKLASSTMKVILNFPGVGEIEADAADISADGIGIILYHPHIKLEPGLVIDKCEIRIPQQAPIKASIRIQYSTTMQFTDGEIVKRSGCQFIGLTDEAKELLESYLSSLDDKA